MTLKLGSSGEVLRMIKNLSLEVEIIIDRVIELCFYMKGAITYEELMRRTPGEKYKIEMFIKKYFEQKNKK
jgi:hypothetical protein